ncbi:MAG: DUF104 domain-containing protein [Spirochaetes bacterium]|nr:DUF104 domain-containing protein [Spirochaetota bacterium]
MLVITGIFENERFIPDTPVSLPQKQKVTVLIEEEKPDELAVANVKKQGAFQRFMQYKGALPADFDCKKELAEYRSERLARQ